MIARVIVPDLGVTGGELKLVEWQVSEGDFVTSGAVLFLIESDKATHEVEAFQDGYVRRILVAEGAQIEIGGAVALLTDTPDEPMDTDTSAKAPSQASGASVDGGAASTEELLVPGDAPPGGGLSVEALTRMYRRMVLIRRYEDHLYKLFLQGQVPGTLHQCQGQEAVAVGVAAGLRKEDVIFSTHRPVGHLLAKGASLEAITAEIWGKATGCAGGKGGQMHLLDLSVGAMPTNAIVGANIPIAAGSALGFKLSGSDRVAVSFFGDGATNIGAFHEGINLAAVKEVPVVFVCENNLYAASTHLSLTSKVTDIAERATSYGIPGVVVDGMDVTAVYHSAHEAIERARSGKGPTLLECKTYRYPGHSRGDPGNYRGTEELEVWRGRDPILRLREQLMAEYQLEEKQLAEIETRSQEEVEAAVRFAVESPEPPPEACFGPLLAEREVRP
jgi:pyruvate dehydrogenase E1 component alpha subunit